MSTVTLNSFHLNYYYQSIILIDYTVQAVCAIALHLPYT